MSEDSHNTKQFSDTMEDYQRSPVRTGLRGGEGGQLTIQTKEGHKCVCAV